jgi:hypothetical protein
VGSHLPKHSPVPLPMTPRNRALAIGLLDQDALPASPFGVVVSYDSPSGFSSS